MDHQPHHLPIGQPKPPSSHISCSLQLIAPDQDHLHATSIHFKKDKRPSSMTSVNNFIQKTFMILQEQRFQSIVSWAESTDIQPECRPSALKQWLPNLPSKSAGTQSSSFKIHNIKAFEEIVLPQYFKHSNMSSFVRQLNMYNFHKVRGDKNEFEFEHDKFIKDRPDLLHEIKRKQVQSSASIPSISLIPNQNFNNLLQHPKASSNLNIADNLSRDSKNDQEKGQKDNSSPIKREESYGSANHVDDSAYRLSELQEANRMLRKSKQGKLALLKQISNINKASMVSKFNKILIAMIATKSSFEGNEGLNRSNSKNNIGNLSEIIEHIMDHSALRSFSEYLAETQQLFQIHESPKKTL